MQDKFIIELNKELTVKHARTTCDKVEIKDEKLFEFPKCFLKFDDDRVNFEFQVLKDYRWKEVSGVKYAIVYESEAQTTLKKYSKYLPIVSDVSTEESSFSKVTLKSNIKEVVLNLFSMQKKEFKLIVDYEISDETGDCETKSYRTTLVAQIPDIDQKDWYASAAFTNLFKPETMSPELIKLFQRNFKLGLNSSVDESTLCGDLLEYAAAPTEEKFNKFNFLQMFQRMICIEDLFSSKLMEEYGLRSQQVLRFNSINYNLRQQIESHLKVLMCQTKMRPLLNGMFVIEAPKKMPADVMEFDHIYLTDMQDYQNFTDDLHEIAEYRVSGKIAFMFGNIILFKPVNKNRREDRSKPKVFIDEDRPYHVEFVPNRISIRVAHRAIDDAVKNNMSRFLRDFTFPNVRIDKKAKVFEKFQWMNASIKKNDEQKTAIKNIVNRTSFPSPYVIFGPPGTGKSTAIVEAIAQIIKLKPRAHILVTASSNSTCDDIGNRLLKYVSVNKVLRIYSPSFDKKPEKIDKKLEPISNFRHRYVCQCNKRSCPELQPVDDPTYEEFYTTRVVIATLVSCGRIVSAGIKATHFDYIFIDEAASDSEQFTLIPISGLAASLNGINAQIVLSGDHKQLGAIVTSPFNQKLGMEKSMMERLMETNKRYQRNGSYNQRFVTLLIQNYRSHEAILRFSNENFYDSQLVAKCPPAIANFAVGCDILFRNKDFPLLFHTTLTPSKEVGTSLMNEGEVNVLTQYVKLLLGLGVNNKKVSETDIGIISPYRAQRDLIIEQFDSEHPKIEVGTVDSFQGREKKIIIFTTVRSKTRHVGFLRNEKRLNVALTRAQSLLIIIGNAATLQKCVIWNKFISYCNDNHAIVGDILSFDSKTASDKNFKGAEQRSNDESEDEYDE